MTEYTEHELERGNRWFIRLRWLAAAGIVVAALVAGGPLGYPIPVTRLMGLGLLVAIYNGVFYFAERNLSRHEGTRYRPALILAHVQIVADVIALAALVHLAGGIENPFAVYFVFHTIIAGILLSRTAAYGQATLAVTLYAGVVFGEQYGLLAHTPIFASPGEIHTSLDVAGQVAVLGSALFTTAYLTSTITARLRQREQELAAALEEVQRHAHACAIAHANLQETQALQLRYMRRVSHELRAPLASIGMMLRVMRDGLTGEIPPKVRETVERAEARTETLLDLVEDLLTLSRMREAPLPEARRELEVGELVAGVVDALIDIATVKGVKVTTELAPELPPVYGQPEALHTMLLNLLGNAVKYTPTGGIATIYGEVEGEWIWLRISDTGSGIAPEHIPRLFEEFYRTPTAQGSQIHGSGLGLAIVKAIIEAHGGEVTVTSELGQGSTFSVRLPTCARLEGEACPE